MTFPRRLLTSGEDVVREVHPHWKALAAPVFVTVVAAAAVGVLLVKTGHSIPGVAQLLIVVAAFAIWLPVAGLPMARWRFTEYVLTNARLIARTGVIAKRAKEIPLETINDITFSQSILDRVLGAGDLVLESAGEHGQEIFADVPHPAELQKEIYATAQERKRAGLPGGTSVADELEKLAGLRDRGVLTAAEFDARKRRLLDS